jgi:hypothetical protein
MKRLFSIALLLTIGFTTAQAQKLKTAEEYNNRKTGTAGALARIERAARTTIGSGILRTCPLADEGVRAPSLKAPLSTLD